jgi:rSAM/selenodomain-associated transferase 2
MTTALSIVVPVLNEARTVEGALRALLPLRERGAEVVVVDGGSSDGTWAIAAPLADRALAAPRGRARQMNAGAAVARGAVLLFLHADTLLPSDADRLIAQALAGGAAWGRFDVCIEGRPRMLRIVAALMNARSRWTGVATGDQALFVNAQVFARLGGYADQPLMEDIELCKRLLQSAGRPACLHARVRTSGRRWEARGVWPTIWLMWRLRWRYWRGESPQTLAEDYR